MRCRHGDGGGTDPHPVAAVLVTVQPAGELEPRIPKLRSASRAFGAAPRAVLGVADLEAEYLAAAGGADPAGDDHRLGHDALRFTRALRQVAETAGPEAALPRGVGADRCRLVPVADDLKFQVTRILDHCLIVDRPIEMPGIDRQSWVAERMLTGAHWDTDPLALADRSALTAGRDSPQRP